MYISVKIEPQTYYQYDMTQKEDPWKLLFDKSITLLQNAADREEAMQHLCALLYHEIPSYDWVGFYMVDPLSEGQLILGSYVGKPTEHTRIAFGNGVCGQAAETRKTMMVDDVHAESNYLACSPSVQSEIVVPIIRSDELVGVIDIDSNTKNAFGKQDKFLLETIAKELAKLF